ncbi:MAG TPA: hypothetical protein VFQ35_09110 [Polyangiaceae bacterium]|nr:hypothetical protein [Polyangiaceae bacterium]
MSDDMAHEFHDPRTRPVPDDLRDRARALMRERGPRAAAMALGISRTALLAICGGADVLPGTLALVREAERAGGRIA